VRRFSRSEVKGQVRDQTECYDGIGMRFDGVLRQGWLVCFWKFVALYVIFWPW